MRLIEFIHQQSSNSKNLRETNWMKGLLDDRK